MKAPSDAVVFEGDLATFWFEEDLLCAHAKSCGRTLEKQKENYDLVRRISGNKKVCLLTDVTSVSPQDKETRDYMAAELPNVFKAMAVVSSSVWGKFVTNLFLALKQQPIPIKFFSSEAEAREWIKQYL